MPQCELNDEIAETVLRQCRMLDPQSQVAHLGIDDDGRQIVRCLHAASVSSRAMQRHLSAAFCLARVRVSRSPLDGESVVCVYFPSPDAQRSAALAITRGSLQLRVMRSCALLLLVAGLGIVVGSAQAREL